MRDYIQGFLVYAKYGTARKSQTNIGLGVSDPMKFLGLDFVEPFLKYTGIKER